MREIEMAVETLEQIAADMRIAEQIFEQFPLIHSVNVGVGEMRVGVIERDEQFVHRCRFVLNAEFFEVPNVG